MRRLGRAAAGGVRTLIAARWRHDRRDLWRVKGALPGGALDADRRAAPLDTFDRAEALRCLRARQHQTEADVIESLARQNLLTTRSARMHGLSTPTAAAYPTFPTVIVSGVDDLNVGIGPP